MKHIIISNNIITIISFAVNLVFILQFIFKIYIFFTKKRYLKNVLLFNYERIQIYQSIFELKTVEGYKYNFVTQNSLEGVCNILNILYINHNKFSFVNQIDNARNEICIGSFLPNKRVNSYFSKYFENFKFYTEEENKEFYDKYPVDKQMIIYSKSKTGFKINEEIFLETACDKKDYAFLIKLTDEDFENDIPKVVHILFGMRSISTIKATEYLSTCYKTIYKKFNRKHYFFAIEINLIDNSFNQKKGIIDLTNEMFNQKS